jgi:hypothetical protein
MSGTHNAAARIAVITAAFRDAPDVNREALLYKGSWESPGSPVQSGMTPL